MVENTKIEWATHTFNPWIGCAKVSPGCEHCYAETLMDTRYGRVKWGKDGTRVLTGDNNWRKPVLWNREADAVQQNHSANLGTYPQRPRVFCASLADIFEDRDELLPWLARLVILIEECPNLDWLLLTKRPQNVLERLARIGVSEDWFEVNSHVWVGTSVEDQIAARKRISYLIKIPAAVRFLSMEPLLSPVDLNMGNLLHLPPCPQSPLNKGAWSHLECDCREYHPGFIQWVIVGGESGHGARPMHPDWVRFLRDQCQAASVNFFFKQWGEWSPDGWGGIHNKKPRLTLTIDGNQGEFRNFGPEDSPVQMTMVGKAAAGRLLDGREWSEFPTVQIAGD